MKFGLKYLWSLVLVPILLFVKGDLSSDMFLQVSELDKPVAEARKAIDLAAQEETFESFTYSVQAVSDNSDFTAQGMVVSLYDAEYNKITIAQVSGSHITFKVPSKLTQKKNFYLVAEETSSEFKLDSLQQKEVSLEINEAHLNQ